MAMAIIPPGHAVRVSCAFSLCGENLALPATRSRLRTKSSSKILRRGACRASFEEDAPFAIAIGVCVLSTLVLPTKDMQSEKQTKNTSVLGADDVRYAAMGIISFIPLFDWLAWVFAWLDTSQQRYLVYSIVYLAPFFRSGLSLSTDESWLPLASVVACVLHVQLDIAVNTESLEQDELKSNISRMLFEKTKVKELGKRGSILFRRLQNLAERYGTDKVSELEGIPEKEFEEWDEKLLKSNKKNANDADEDNHSQ